MPSITEQLFCKLDAIARYAGGYFMLHAITPDKPERDALIRIKARNPEFFDTKNYAGSTLVQLTQSYCNFRGLRLVVAKNYSNLEIARRLIWVQFMIEKSYFDRLPNGSFKLGSRWFIIDDFGNGMAAKIAGNDVVVTDQSRLSFFTELVVVYVPDSLRSVKARKIMCSLLGIPLVSEVPQVMIKENLIDSGFWPKSRAQCHIDERHYPLFSERISGVVKWKYDKEILKSGRIPEGYKFGVYSAEFGGQDGVI